MDDRQESVKAGDFRVYFPIKPLERSQSVHGTGGLDLGEIFWFFFYATSGLGVPRKLFGTIRYEKIHPY